jgi:hypothetical protein
MSRLDRRLALAGTVLALVGVTAPVALAQHGADDPAGHVRHSDGADDAVVGIGGGGSAAGSVTKARSSDDHPSVELSSKGDRRGHGRGRGRGRGHHTHDASSHR